ncbi:hypothetical protein MTO96_010913 [Rhipicephalus appendiculatus]
MHGFALSVTIAVLYSAATTEGVPLRESVRPEEDGEADEPTTAFEGTLPLQEEDETEPSASLKVINGTVPFRGAVPCNQRSDCDDVLVCLPSKICGCPELTPVLLQDVDGIVCASARRLSESCLSDAECMHGNEHARCLDSSCSCQSRFYVSTDGSLCLPDFLAWSPLRTAVLPAVLPAVLLILGFVALGVLGYQRLRRSRNDKAQHPQQSSSLPKSIGCSGRVTSDSDGSLDEHDDRPKSHWRWLRSFDVTFPGTYYADADASSASRVGWRRIRRDGSSKESYPLASPKIQVESSSSCCCGPSCPNVHFNGPSVESWSQHEGCSSGSCMKLSCDERDVLEDLKLNSTRSQPMWPCDRVVRKGPDLKARTCEAFTVCGKGALPEKIRKLLASPPHASGATERFEGWQPLVSMSGMARQPVY